MQKRPIPSRDCEKTLGTLAFERLKLEQTTVDATVLSHQFGVGAVFFQLTPTEDKNPIQLHHRGKAMSHHDDRAVLHQAAHCLLHQGFRF